MSHRMCVKRIAALMVKLADREKERRSAVGWLKVAEQILNDQTVYGPGAPHIPGLFEVRTALSRLRKPLSRRTKRKTP